MKAAEIVTGVYGPDTVTANYAQFWFRRFGTGIFDVKHAPRTGRPIIENVHKIIEIIEVDRHVSSRSIARELKIDHETVLNHLHKAGFEKKIDVWVPHQLTQKTMLIRISICDVLAKRNEIDPFLVRMVTGGWSRSEANSGGVLLERTKASGSNWLSIDNETSVLRSAKFLTIS
ncbi:histone-lysine N-methyltransferase SETMAR-like [Augochlora pura]